MPKAMLPMHRVQKRSAQSSLAALRLVESAATILATCRQSRRGHTHAAFWTLSDMRQYAAVIGRLSTLH